MSGFAYKLLYNESRKLRTIYKIVVFLVCLITFHYACEVTDYIENRTARVYIVTQTSYIYHIYDWCHLAKEDVKNNGGDILPVKLHKLDKEKYSCCEYCQEYYQTKIELSNNK